MVNGFTILGRHEFAQQSFKDQWDRVVTNNRTDDWPDCFETIDVNASEPQTDAWEVQQYCHKRPLP